jgi:AMME syndrome candidate gene 1 protein
MCYHCFDALIDELRRKNLAGVVMSYASAASMSSQELLPLFQTIPPIDCPLFVTWEKKNSTTLQYELRGCIGTLAARRLPPALGEYAILSALRDRRFKPISPAEIPQLLVAVSLLVEYEPCEDWQDWIIGTHGIVLKFYPPSSDKHDDGEDTAATSTTTTSRGRTELSATYLPEVAPQQRWDHQQTVSSLMQKAGYKGIIDDELLRSARCTRYQSSKVKITFAEYMQYCEESGRPLDSSSVPAIVDEGSSTLCGIM